MSVLDSWLLILSAIGLAILVFAFLDYCVGALVAWWTDQSAAEEAEKLAIGAESSGLR